MDENEKNRLEGIYKDYLNNPLILKMKEVPMHRGSNTYIHSFLVAKASIKKAIKSKRKLDLESILIGAILHDYYLYDWRLNKKLLKKHAKSHPFIAKENAKRDFNISDKVAKIIVSQMWPFNFKLHPKTKEGWIVANKDTFIATKEALTSKKYKEKRIDKTMKSIEHLFD